MRSQPAALWLVAAITAVLGAQSAEARQDGRFIPKLRWVSPHGELPGTQAEYLAWHPLRPARFSGKRPLAPVGLHTLRGDDTNEISILVDEALYESIVAPISQYTSDLIWEGYAVHLETVSGGTPDEIKTWLQQRYAAGCEQFVFVGDITAAWAEVSGAVFPCDLFYMDLDGNWVDADHDGDYETHNAGSGDEGPEIYVGRIYAHTLGYGSEASMVAQYIDKTHAYRSGVLRQPWRGLEYVEEDWYTMYVALDLIYGNDVVRHDAGYFTTGADYLDQMDLGQHFVQVCAHSYSGGHYFSRRPTESATYAHIYVYSPSTRTARLLLGSNDGIKVWLNGENVLTQDVYQAWTPDQFVVSVWLNQGWNRLLCKISQRDGAYQFSARFTDEYGQTFQDLEYQLNDPDGCGGDGGGVGGLTYEPAPDPISYIGTWLINGAYWNPDQLTRLSHDYLDGEADVRPSEGDSAPMDTWERGVGSGYPFDIVAHFDHGDWVFSQTIQDRDPPVLFYNLFACGPGRFTDTNYLAGAYIFNTTYGLITVASSKSGSMLNFQDFTDPLGQGKTIGTAFRQWFDTQAPFEQWEREWYYGMVLCGDPTLRPVRIGDLDRDGDVDLEDLAILLTAYGTCEGQPGYDARADLDGSGCVDLADLAALLTNYGLGT